MKKIFNSKGFTLLELMIVVAILGVVATVSMRSYSLYMNRSKVTEAVVYINDCTRRLSEESQATGGKLASNWRGMDAFFQEMCMSNGRFTNRIGGMTFYNSFCCGAYLMISMKQDASPISGRIITYEWTGASSGGIDGKWICRLGGSGYEYAYGPPGSVGAMMPAKYLPKDMCR